MTNGWLKSCVSVCVIICPVTLGCVGEGGQDVEIQGKTQIWHYDNEHI